MDRNKLVYGLADAAIVVASTDGKGGTWAGAIEALRRSKIPIYVRASGCIPAGNRHLLELGARALTEDVMNTIELLSQSPPPLVSLFDGRVLSGTTSSQGAGAKQELNGFPLEPKEVVREEEAKGDSGTDQLIAADLEGTKIPSKSGDAYSAVEPLLLDILKEPLDEKVIADKLGLVPAQARAWLKESLNKFRGRASCV